VLVPWASATPAGIKIKNKAIGTVRSTRRLPRSVNTIR
jgi:hypothetical protein